MNKLLSKRELAPLVKEYVISAPEISRHAQPGQFVIVRVDDDGERVPFTICDYNRNEGTITLLVQEVGYSTIKLSTLSKGDYIHDIVGPLGLATDLSAYKNICLVGGGIGSAVIYPQSKKLKSQGVACDVIIGARNRELFTYIDEFKRTAQNLYLITDDGSSGKQGFVTDLLNELAPQKKYDCVFAVGPMPMMRAVCNLTKQLNVKTIVSMNSTMVDGTGMCGCCRVTVGGETKYACVHGPEFDGHLIDWDEAINRSRAYKDIEQQHVCRIRGTK